MPRIEETSSSNTPKTETLSEYTRDFVRDHDPTAPYNDKGMVSKLFWEQVGGVSEALVEKIGKGEPVTRRALADAVQDESLNQDEMTVVSGLYKNFDLINDNQRGRFGRTAKYFGNFGLSSFFPDTIDKEDLNYVKQAGKDGDEAFLYIDRLMRWAWDGSGFVRFTDDASFSQKDLDIAIHRIPDASSLDYWAINELRVNFDSISKEGQIGEREMLNYYKRIRAMPHVKLSDSFEQAMQYVHHAQENPAADRLFADRNNPINSVKANSVYQGFAGDCAFRAALAGLANARPEEILPMIKDSGDGTFAVTLPGVSGDALTVEKPTDGELGLYSHQSPDGIWPTVMTKAYGEKVYRDAGMFEVGRMSEETVAEHAAADGDQRNAIEALTGHEVTALRIDQLDDAQLSQLLLQARNEKRVMVLNTADGGERTESGFSTNHAFTILSVNPKEGTGDIELTVRDPLDRGHNRPDGVKTINLKTLRENFESVFVETDQPV